MDAVHDQIAKIVGIPTGLYLVHHVHKELIAYFKGIQVVATHALLDSSGLDHTHPYHENLPFAGVLYRIEELYLQQV